MSTFDDILDLLQEVDELRSRLDTDRIEAMRDEAKLELARTKVKSCLEHLRSCLDYSAHAVREKHYTPKKIYFPYGLSQVDFTASLKSNLPALDSIAPDVFLLIERMQPFSCGDTWLHDLCSHTNKMKHRELPRQRRENSKQHTTHIPGIIEISGDANIQIGRIIIDGELANKNGPLIIKSDRSRDEIQADIPGLVVTRQYDSVSFKLDGTAIDVLDLVDRGRKEISDYSNDLESVL